VKALSQPTGFFCAREIEDGCGARDIARIGRRSPLIARFKVCGFGLRPIVLQSNGSEIARIEQTAITTAAHFVVLRIACFLHIPSARSPSKTPRPAARSLRSRHLPPGYSQIDTVVWI
jgi:hypothetical protein